MGLRFCHVIQVCTWNDGDEKYVSDVFFLGQSQNMTDSTDIIILNTILTLQRILLCGWIEKKLVHSACPFHFINMHNNSILPWQHCFSSECIIYAVYV